MKALYDDVSFDMSRKLTRRYSTSFSLGIKFLAPELRDPVYAIYGFVRLADEIVDSFHDYDKEDLFRSFKKDVDYALRERISINPILNSFQDVVYKYDIDRELIDTFLESMEMDLDKSSYDRPGFDRYVLGSAEVVGLMCLKIFCKGDREMYEKLKPYGMSLGAAYQKINFLRDLNADFNGMGRSYFPGINLKDFSTEDKLKIEKEVEQDFAKGLEGIKMLPASASLGVYLSYVYYYKLFQKIRRTSPDKVMTQRIRISNPKKYMLLLNSYMRHKMNIF